MMSQMSTNYPVMQILGYQKIDPKENLLVSEQDSLTFYPRSSTAMNADGNTIASATMQHTGEYFAPGSIKPRKGKSQQKSRRENGSRLKKTLSPGKNTGSIRSTKMTSYCDVTNPTRHLEPNLELSKVGNHPWRFYDDVPSARYD